MLINKNVFQLNTLRALLLVVTAVGFLSSFVAYGEAKENKAARIARALSAAPADISDNASVVDVDGTVLREGSNGWTCIPGIPLIPGDDHPMCNDATWMAWLKAAGEGKPFTTDVIGVSYMLKGDAMVNNADPAATGPAVGRMWVKEGPHLMMLFPNASMLADLPRDPYAGGPYVMWDNTPLVHVMVPVKEKKEPASK